ncbi:MAG TPA: serine/threonine-protein kinase [Verrucomicrobiae bacterium]
MTSEAIKPDIFATGAVNVEACSKSQVGAGRYTLVKILGRGGMGIVWLARDELLATDVALKFLPPQIRFDSVALDDLRRETSRSRKLTHPNVIRIHDFYDAKNEEAFVSMEFVEGANLASVRVEKPQRVLTWEFLAPLVRQLCDGLEYAHGERVIHRDLKPANLMLDTKGRLKLADFGIARTLNDTMTRVSMNPGTSGTLLYMSPQQLEGKTPHVTDDIYALGATLYELLTSKPPFFSGDFLHQVRHATPLPLHQRLKEWEINNPIPAHVEKIILSCLEKDEKKRPQSAHEVAEQLGLAPEFKAGKKFHQKFSRKNYYAMSAAGVASMIFLCLGFNGLIRKNASVAQPRMAQMSGPKPVVDPWNDNFDNPPPAKDQIAKAAPPITVMQSAPVEKESAPPVGVAPTTEQISAPPATAPAPPPQISPDTFTALQLVKLGDHYVSDASRDQVIEIVSDKSVDDLMPRNWRVLYHNHQATFHATEVQFADGKMIRVREPNRFIQIFSPSAHKTFDLSKVDLDSDDALKIVMDLPEVRAASVIAVQMRLARGYGGLPVWTINLFGESDSKLTNEKNLGTIELLADSGKILKNTVAKKANEN